MHIIPVDQESGHCLGGSSPQGLLPRGGPQLSSHLRIKPGKDRLLSSCGGWQNSDPCEAEHRGPEFLATWVPGTWQLTYTEAAKEKGSEQQGTYSLFLGLPHGASG